MRLNPLPPAITGDVCRIVIQYLGLSGTYINTLDYQASALNAVTSATLAALAAAFQTAVEPSLKACLSDQATIAAYFASCLSLSTPATDFLVSGVAGTVAQPCLPNEMGAVIQKRTLLKGQHGRGRITLPAVPTTFTTPATNPDKINVTGGAAYSSLVTALEGNLAAGGLTFTPCLSVRPAPPAILVTHAQQVTNFALNTILGTARRRKEGRGT